MPRLKRVRPYRDAGYRRVRAGSGFRYLDQRGRAVSARERRRIEELVIPPAWTDVWISADPHGHIQVVGTDDAGRAQYLYHPQWTTHRDRRKYARALVLAAALPAVRGQVTRALRAEDLGRDRVLAAAIRMLDEGALRIGSQEYLTANGSRGLTTLQRRDVRVDAASVSLSFPAKSGKRMLLTIEDPDLAAAVEELGVGRAGAALLAYRQGRRRVALRAKDVNAHLRTLVGGEITAKDFRTLQGTILAAEALAVAGESATARDVRRAERLAVDAAANALGNTSAVARRSYIDPRVFARYREGRMLELGGAREAALLRLLE